jgi:hypothetical protein
MYHSICQGMHIADRSLFLAISRLLWAFDFKRVLDDTTGREVIPDMEDVTGGLFIQPSPFEVDIVPRSESRAKRIEEEWKQVLGLLDSDLQWKATPEGIKWRDYETS